MCKHSTWHSHRYAPGSYYSLLCRNDECWVALIMFIVVPSDLAQPRQYVNKMRSSASALCVNWTATFIRSMPSKVSAT
jgi:hypothetical protein